MKEYLTDTQEVLKNLGSSYDMGLSQAEAQKRLEENGKNKLNEAEKETVLQRFIKELKDPMLIVLMCAALVSAVTSLIKGETPTDAIVIVLVVLLNAVLGVYQESKAEKAIEALQEMSAAMSKVVRNGHAEEIKTEDIVVGDIVLLEAGMAVPCDMRIIEQASLQCEEAALTGESLPVYKTSETLNLPADAKDVPLGDRKNMAYAGSTVVYGRGRAVATATGMDTEMGKIADAISKTTDGQTPLQIKLTQLSMVLTKLVLAISVFIFVFSLVRSGSWELENILEVFLIAVSLAVAAIPEGLATVVTIVLSIGVTNMSKRNAVIRKLTAVETLGSTQIICSDKTGTLTQNKMTVIKRSSKDETLLSRAMALCSDSQWVDGNAVGEPTENALVMDAANMGMNKDDLDKQYPRIAEAPFDSLRKMMSVFVKENGEIRQYTKGAPDVVIKLCDSFWDGEKVLPMTEETRSEILAQNHDMAQEALRVLSCAMRTYKELPSDISPENVENNMCFIGMVGMLDPVRPEVIPAVDMCRTAGIHPIMITGDHRDTASAIAKQLGMIQSIDESITGSELDNLSDEDLLNNVEKYSVYARVQPEHKVRIVEAWQKKGMVTAMTGDGVNDAPSIKKADIGVGMGITGTDVTKNVADMVLADDNFATIVSAVEEGRRIYDNIRKALQFLIGSNLSEVVSIFAATMIGFVILKPAHLLWINLITDTFPALALGMEAPDKNVMQRPPRPKNEGIFAGGLGFDALYQGVMVSILTIGSYLVGHFMESGRLEFVNSPDGMTMAFLTMSLAEVFHSFNMRSQRQSVFSLKSHNLYLYGAMLLSLLLTATVIFIPFLSNAFGFEHISFVEYLVAMAFAISVIPIVETVKFFQRRFSKQK
ncbi:MAG: cation-translocating P-type ATPase [Eubacteriales bacterium]|nr:cation-translocating P-type ATPase [Eubacteriales bacterium]